ncbi:MAG: endonuclease domain-containing protein [Spirochaetales bacterium]|nr:endonuclease domain-containing protein [Spirochaetales bacterium]
MKERKEEAPQPPEGGGYSVPVAEGGDKSGYTFDLSNRIPSVLYSANPYLYKVLKIRAEEMRANPTRTEKILWEKLKNKQIGIKFRQQHVINKFIVDFCSIKSALIIEVDGAIHKNQKEADAERTRILEKEGYKVIRFTNKEIFYEIDTVVKKIREEATQPPKGGGRYH